MNKYVRKKFKFKENQKQKKKDEESKVIFLNIIFRQTCHNFFIHVADMKNKNIIILNGGVSNLFGKYRGSIRSIEIVSKILFKKIERIEKFVKIPVKFILVLKTSSNLLTKIFVNLLLSKLSFYKFVEFVKVPHNGVKRKKVKRR